MKSKIRSLVIICTLGLVGVLNANAALSYNTSSVPKTLKEVENVKSENLNSSEFVFNTGTEIDYQKEAQLVTKWIADKEEAKIIQMLIDKNVYVPNDEAAFLAGDSKSENLNSPEFVFNEDTAIDYVKEARQLTKWNADKEEAKAVQKLVSEGKLVGDR